MKKIMFLSVVIASMLILLVATAAYDYDQTNEQPPEIVVATDNDTKAVDVVGITYVPKEEEEVEPEPEPEYIEYTVEAGDSLWSIASNHYGDGNLYTKIAADNGIKVTDVIHPGDVLKIFPEDTATAVAVQYSSVPVEDIEEEPKPVEVINTSSFNGDMDMEEAIAILRDVPSTDTSGMEYLGTYRITGYDPHCSHCCGKTDGITASGRQAEFGVTAGCNSLPLGTEVYIEGYGFYRIDDTGGMSNNVIDIAAPSHDVCYTLTNNSVNVWIVS